MRVFNELILNAGDASGNLASGAILLEQDTGYAIQVVLTGSPVGTLTLQGSCDPGTNAPVGNAAGTGVSNWTTITNSSQAVNGAGTVMYVQSDAYYKWVRLVYTFTSGTGSVTARINAKGF